MNGKDIEIGMSVYHKAVMLGRGIVTSIRKYPRIPNQRFKPGALRSTRKHSYFVRWECSPTRGSAEYIVEDLRKTPKRGET